MLDEHSVVVHGRSIQQLAPSTQQSAMPEQRTDWLTGRTVLVAENRVNRPNEFDRSGTLAATKTDDAAFCPFCPGHESETPPALYEQFDDRNRRRVRGVPNKYPAVTDSIETANVAVASNERSPADLFAITSAPAFGVHEVIVETARHVARTSALSESELRHVLEAYAHRLRHWSTDGRLAYGLVFKNQGARAGASLAHLHSQLIALPALPPAVEAEIRRARGFYSEHRECAYCRLIQNEQEAAVRVVDIQDGYVAFCPFASLQPCEVWVMPARHEPSFERALSENRVDGLAKLLRAVIQGIESLVPSASFNMLLRTAPWQSDSDAYAHWRIELQPRMNAIAGLETATGIFVNPVAPERAAGELRRR
jgi:UDPglucose--hexose-1-phosphate uridylyltransferase